jgi:hypothetical protein
MPFREKRLFFLGLCPFRSKKGIAQEKRVIGSR